jgi:hypothetical protein
LPEGDSIRQWCPARDHRTGRVDAGSTVEQRIHHRNVIAVRGPVERSFLVPTREARVNIGAVR